VGNDKLRNRVMRLPGHKKWDKTRDTAYKYFKWNPAERLHVEKYRPFITPAYIDANTKLQEKNKERRRHATRLLR